MVVICFLTRQLSSALDLAWTACPYVVHDGRVNPDVRSLSGPGAINDLSETAIYNAIAYAISDSTICSKNFARLIDTFFLNESTRMYPNMNYGQIVRGPLPSGSLGTFTGILDLRGLVKVINGILIIKEKQSQDWTSARDQSMNTWVKQYIEWLAESDIGKEAASRPKYVTVAIRLSLNKTPNDLQQSCFFLLFAGCGGQDIRW